MRPPSKDRLLEVLTCVEPGSDDVTFTHAVFAQCFLPLRKLPKGRRLYEVRHGRAALLVDAGHLLSPVTKRFEQMEVPSGSAARIALAHINNHIIRAKSVDEALCVPMGESLRDYMGYQGITICGTNGKAIAAQVHNLAAARISLGVWSGEHTRQIDTKIADTIDFWLEKDRRQRTLWQPYLQVSEGYAAAVREHCVPHDLRALIGLYKDTRAMDIYVWLAYRLPRIPEQRALLIPYDHLKPIFGSGVEDVWKFRQVFRRALRVALTWYRDARVGIEKDGVRLCRSPSPVPIDVARSPYGRTVAGGRRRLSLVAPTR